MANRSPGEHPHTDRPNFSAEDYLQMCSDGEAEYTDTELARLLGVSRMHLWRCRLMASVPDDAFEEAIATMREQGKPLTTTAIADELKRRTGQAREYAERCPHCGGALRTRRR